MPASIATLLLNAGELGKAGSRTLRGISRSHLTSGLFLFSLLSAAPIIGIDVLTLSLRYRWRRGARFQAALAEIGYGD